MTSFKARAAAGLLAAAALAACAHVTPPQRAEIPVGAKYVALGSSFAAGPGVTQPAETPRNRCNRSSDNYPRQLARRRGLVLVDVSCGGATTRHLLGPWAELPAQLEAVDAETRLVTITIGGNDLGYIGRLMAASCSRLVAEAGTSAGRCRPFPPPTEKAFAEVGAQMRAIAAEARRRAPHARIVFVDYPAVLPPQGTCAATPLTEEEAEEFRRLAVRLSEATERAARASGADFLAASRISADHHACAAEPWMNGYPRPGAPVDGTPYHPNLAGMTAVAEALDRMLRERPAPPSAAGS